MDVFNNTCQKIILYLLLFCIKTSLLHILRQKLNEIQPYNV